MRHTSPPSRWAAIPGVLVVAAAVLLVSGTRGATATHEVDWAKLNPAFAGATYVNDKSVCASCHQESMTSFEHTRHAQVFAHRSVPGGECESCHGPRSKHAESPDASLKLTGARKESAVCMQCHEGGSRMGWRANEHARADVSCTSCHSVMAKRSERGLLTASQAKETCYACHSDVRSSMAKSSHHPVREGRMDCADCHDVHASRGPSMLTKASVNETCATCHADKRGPFVWEHAPARESCSNCHEAHGSSNRGMLVTSNAMLCLQCHSYGGHINLQRYNRTSNPYGTGCTNCHVTPHGSNHPSGAKLTR